jgi:prevent-host-death family protein
MARESTMRVGLREANQKFAELVKAARNGKEVIITDRGKPVARLVPMTAESSESRIRRMEEAGILIPARKQGPLPPFRGVKLHGKSIVETIREMRDEEDG